MFSEVIYLHGGIKDFLNKQIFLKAMDESPPRSPNPLQTSLGLEEVRMASDQVIGHQVYHLKIMGLSFDPQIKGCTFWPTLGNASLFGNSCFSEYEMMSHC